MKITIIAIGSHGDIQPCVALGRGLMQAGYDVRLATMDNYRSLVEDNGLEFFHVDGDARALTNASIPTEGKSNGMNLLAMWRSLMDSFGSMTESYHKAFSDPKLHDSDAILCQLPASLYGYDLAEYLKVPFVALSVIPQEMTGAYPLSLFPSRKSFGRAYNRLTYRIGQQLVWRPFYRPINKFRKELGLSPAPFWNGHFAKMRCENVPVLQGVSKSVIPQQPEWGSRVHNTGYWDLPEPEWQPPAELVEFLDAGEAPIYIGFGSMPIGDPQATTRMILDAIQQSGKRCILHSGWANLGGDDLPDTVFPIKYVPYWWLFPRMSALIHHGGSGTTGLALRSGVPSMIVPFTADQPFWGERTQVLGVGVKPIPFTKLTSEKLVEAIHTLTTDSTLKANAQQLRAKMQSEPDGVETAVKVIQGILG